MMLAMCSVSLPSESLSPVEKFYGFDNKSWTDLACLQAQMGAHRHTNGRPPQQFLLCMTLAHHLPKIFLLHTLRILDVSILHITNTNLKDIFAKE